MGKLIMATAKYGISVNYICKSLYAKYKGRKCKDYMTQVCMTCDLCQAEMSGYNANKLLNVYGARRYESMGSNTDSGGSDNTVNVTDKGNRKQ